MADAVKKSGGEGEKIWNRTFVKAFAVAQLNYLCAQMMNTLIPKYAAELGAGANIIGLVAGSFAATALIFKTVSAPALDTYNRKFILMGALGLIFLAFVSYSFSGTIGMLLFSRLLQGAGEAFATTGCLAIASDTLPQNRMSTGIGYYCLSSAIAQAIAPAIGLRLLVLLNNNYNYIFMVLTAIMLISVIAVSTIHVDFVKTKKFSITPSSIIAKEALLPAVMLFLLGTSYYIVNSFLVLYAEWRGVGANIGFFFTVYAVTMLFSRPLIGRMADKYGLVYILIPSMFCFALAFFLISFAKSLPLFLLSGAISAFGYGGSQPAIQALAMRAVPKERRGSATCTNYIGQDLGQLAGPTLGGMIALHWGYAVMFRVMLIPVLIAMIVVIVFRGRMGYTGAPRPGSGKRKAGSYYALN
jgi:MFS family permease